MGTTFRKAENTMLERLDFMGNSHRKFLSSDIVGCGAKKDHSGQHKSWFWNKNLKAARLFMGPL